MSDSIDVDDDLVRHVANLARLQLSDDEVPGITKQFARILEYLDQIPELDGQTDEAVVGHVNFDDLRADEPGPTLPLKQTMTNAPQNDGAFIVVPRFFDGEEA